MILIQNGPSAFGRGDVLIGGGRILHIAEHIDPASLLGKNDIIDGHQHFTGGGGKGGIAALHNVSFFVKKRKNSPSSLSLDRTLSTEWWRSQFSWPGRAALDPKIK